MGERVHVVRPPSHVKKVICHKLGDHLRCHRKSHRATRTTPSLLTATRVLRDRTRYLLRRIVAITAQYTGPSIDFGAQVFASKVVASLGIVRLQSTRLVVEDMQAASRRRGWSIERRAKLRKRVRSRGISRCEARNVEIAHLKNIHRELRILRQDRRRENATANGSRR